MRRFLVRLLLFGGITLLLVELIFRTVIPAAQRGLSAQDPETRIMICESTVDYDGIHTIGRLAHDPTRWHINNCGWNSPLDYLPPSPERDPVIAVIGDSFIEGYHVEGSQHMAAVIARDLGKPWLAYSFGQSGSSLSHYLHIARYAAQRFNPRIFVMLVTDRDIAASLRDVHRNPRNLQLAMKNGAVTEFPPTERYRPSRVKRLMRRSALLRYLMFNAKLDLMAAPRQAVATHESEPHRSDERDDLERCAAQYVVEQMEREHPNDLMVYVVDGPRQDIYAGRPSISIREAAILRQACAGKTRSVVLDMGPIFADTYRATGREMNFADDQHWNALGHKTAGRAAADLLRTMLKRIGAPASAPDTLLATSTSSSITYEDSR